MLKLKQTLALLTAVTCLLTAAGCAGQQTGNSSAAESSAAETTVPEGTDPAAETTAQAAETTARADEQSSVSAKSGAELKKADLNTEWGSDAVTLQLSGDTVKASPSDGVTVKGGLITITKGGDYVLFGTLNDGRIVINLTDKTEKVHLILNGASVTSRTSAAISVVQADKTVITAAAGTDNVLTDAKTYTEFDLEEADSQFPQACIASKDDLTINGTGTLTVSGNYNNGIHCTDDLKLVGGTIQVTAANHGIRGNDSVLLHDGALTVTAGGDGIKSTTADQDGKGDILIEGGTAKITAEQDGIDAAASLTVTDGTLDITAGGGSANAPAHANDDFGGFGKGGRQGGFGGFRGGFGGEQGDFSMDPLANFAQTADTAAEDTTVSTKGIKAERTLTLSGGTLTIDAADDAVHANDTVTISGDAVLKASAGDDGIHADAAVTIEGGETEIAKSYEGIESAKISIKGGTVHVKADDDGLNASDGSGGGMGFNRNGSGELNISGGYLYVNADGDGLDSNGNITMTGGTVIVCGPTNSGNGPLDSGDNNNKITVTGGTLIAVGATGMMETPESNYLASASLNAAAGTLIAVTDDDGRVLAVLKTPKQAQGIVVSADGMSDGYHIYTGGTYDGTLNSDGFGTGGSWSGGTEVATGSGGGGFGGMGGHGGFGGFGGMMPPDGMEPPEGITPPEGFENMTPPDGFGRKGGRDRTESSTDS
ncbi:MAG: carbohydrate-binding domain-containing protein [Oscillospiraceae bacterium]|nr:carbohydrate-binding domain-containing protein [Oscillospiraceae bacterium]